MSRGVFCAIELAPSLPISVPRPDCPETQPKSFNEALPPLAAPQPGLAVENLTTVKFCSRPIAAAADAPAARCKSVVMAHDELSLDLGHSVHGHADDNEQRSTAEIKVHAQPIGHPVGQSLEKPAHRSP